MIKRLKTWVWPKCSGFTSWPATQRSDKLHSVEGSWKNGVCHGLQTFTYCNGVVFRAVFESGIAQGLAIGVFKKKVIWTGNYVDGCLMGNFCAIEPDRGGLLTGDVLDWEMTGPHLTFP